MDTREHMDGETAAFAVLVVDDDEVVRSLISKILRDGGATVFCAEDGEKGWELFQAHAPDLVISDVRMPRLDGIGLLKRIRSVSAKTEVIMVTGFAQTHMVVEALRGGASNFIEKPFEIGEIQRQIGRSLDRCRLDREAGRLRRELGRERRRRELSGRMATIGRLMAGLAHEIHNPLTFLKGNAELVRRLLEARPDAGEPANAEIFALLQDVEFGARRIEELLAALRRFGVASDVPVQTVPAAEIMADCARLVSPRRPQGVHFSVTLPPTDVMVRVRPVELESCLMNLLVNAFEAVTPQGGNVTFSAEAEGASPERGWLEFRVVDDGPGIAPERLREIFTPGITGKRTGMGLGLAIAFDAAKRNGARIEFDSAPERGTAARVGLPWRKDGVEASSTVS